MQFDLNIPLVSIILFSVAFAIVLLICFVYCRRLYLVRRYKAHCDNAEAADPESLPSASVVVYARCEPEALGRLLPKLLQQDYAKPFDVVVVNEGVSPETDVLVESLMATHPNLYLTFTPDGARSLSRKKLAITLGVKAAQGEVVVITEASAQIDSDKWLSTLLRKFSNPEVEVVLGYGHTAVPEQRFLGRLISVFDSGADDVAWIYAALKRHAYRACGYDLAYRRKLFFDNKGFSRSLNLREGDDDIFVSEICNKRNTAVELADAACAWSEPYAYKRHARDQRLSHAFTGRRLYKGTRRVGAMAEWGMWIVVACCICGAMLWNPANIVAWAIAVAITASMLITVSVSWRRTLVQLHYPRLGFTVPFAAMLRPIRNIRVNLKSKVGNHGHYTWQ